VVVADDCLLVTHHPPTMQTADNVDITYHSLQRYCFLPLTHNGDDMLADILISSDAWVICCGCIRTEL
jgi:hypothetical protein